MSREIPQSPNKLEVLEDGHDLDLICEDDVRSRYK